MQRDDEQIERQNASPAPGLKAGNSVEAQSLWHLKMEIETKGGATVGCLRWTWKSSTLSSYHMSSISVACQLALESGPETRWLGILLSDRVKGMIAVMLELRESRRGRHHAGFFTVESELTYSTERENLDSLESSLARQAWSNKKCRASKKTG